MQKCNHEPSRMTSTTQIMRDDRKSRFCKTKMLSQDTRNFKLSENRGKSCQKTGNDSFVKNLSHRSGGPQCGPLHYYEHYKV